MSAYCGETPELVAVVFEVEVEEVEHGTFV